MCEKEPGVTPGIELFSIRGNVDDETVNPLVLGDVDDETVNSFEDHTTVDAAWEELQPLLGNGLELPFYKFLNSRCVIPTKYDRSKSEPCTFPEAFGYVAYGKVVRPFFIMRLTKKKTESTIQQDPEATLVWEDGLLTEFLCEEMVQQQFGSNRDFSNILLPYTEFGYRSSNEDFSQIAYPVFGTPIEVSEDFSSRISPDLSFSNTENGIRVNCWVGDRAKNKINNLEREGEAKKLYKFIQDKFKEHWALCEKDIETLSGNKGRTFQLELLKYLERRNKKYMGLKDPLQHPIKIVGYLKGEEGLPVVLIRHCCNEYYEGYKSKEEFVSMPGSKKTLFINLNKWGHYLFSESESEVIEWGNAQEIVIPSENISDVEQQISKFIQEGYNPITFIFNKERYKYYAIKMESN